MNSLIEMLADEIQDADEETFHLFSQSLPSHDLGMVDAKAKSLQLSIAGEDFEIAQSPGVLQSSRAGGTTGAAVWQASVRLAEWLAWPKNPLHADYLGPDSSVLELGSGISGVVPLKLRNLVDRVLATDQPYLLKTLQDNISNNASASMHASKPATKHGRTTRKSRVNEAGIDVLPLDWESDDIPSFLRANRLGDGVDVIIACDCIFNYALIDPLVQTCHDISQFRATRSGGEKAPHRPTLSIVCQQLRQPEVLSQWLETFRTLFHVWRVPDDLLTEALKEGSGFAVHLAFLRE